MESTGRVSRSLTEGSPDRPPRGAMTPGTRVGSQFCWIFALAIFGGCSTRGGAQPITASSAAPREPAAPRVSRATRRAGTWLGVSDSGIFCDLDDQVQLAL